MATGSKLVIVESPTKAKKIGGYLGSGYTVMASVGHIRDLAQPSQVPAAEKAKYGKFGVDIEDGFKPYYIVDGNKKKTVADLKSALKKADTLYLATDEDREGEAIAWHLVQTLKPKVPVKRMVFHEITPEAISERTLVGSNRLDPTLGLDKVETSGKARDAVTVERARLKARGPLERLQRIEAVHAGAAHGPRSHVNALRHGQTTGALWAHEPLMAGKAHNIEPHGIHVNLRRAGRLRGVDDHQRAGRMSHSRHTCNINGVAGHIGGVRHHHGTRTGRD